MPRMISRLVLTFCSLMALWLEIAEAATLTVPGQFSTIQSAVTEAANNEDITDVIVLENEIGRAHV